MIPPFRFRPLQAEDIPDLRALWQRSPGLGLSAADEPAPLERFFLRNPNCSFGAYAQNWGRLVGTCLGGHDGRRGFLYHVAVDPEFQRQGVGREVVLKVLGALKGQGVGKVHALVFEDNPAGAAFWQALGAVRRRDVGLFSFSF